jgi:non-ribosomal peptide synthase protein (TIGR01720 family)
VLLTAQLTALASYTGSRRLQLDLEHHGRPELAAELDLSRTVGWFTAVFPAVFELPEASLLASLLAVKEQRQRIPSHGLGYGLLRYLCPDAPLLQAEIAQAPSDVSFNYLGQLDASLADSSLFAVAHEAVGPTQSPQARRTHRLEVNAWILHECLHVQWIYSENLHRLSTIAAMAQRFTDVLRALLADASAGRRAVEESASATREGGVEQRESEPKI